MRCFSDASDESCVLIRLAGYGVLTAGPRKGRADVGEFFGVAPGDQFGSVVWWRGIGADAGRRDGLGRAFCRVIRCGWLLRVGHVGVSSRGVAGSGVGGHDGGGRPLCRLVTHLGPTCRGGGRRRARSGGRIRSRPGGHGASGRGRGQSCTAGVAGDDQPVRPERAGDRGRRILIRADVGPGCLGHGRLLRRRRGGGRSVGTLEPAIGHDRRRCGRQCRRRAFPGLRPQRNRREQQFHRHECCCRTNDCGSDGRQWHSDALATLRATRQLPLYRPQCRGRGRAGVVHPRRPLPGDRGQEPDV
ncbi:hypothetical protein YM3MPS_11510 [Mycobacterium pseudoshottsii]|nr:hypothetical protein YM3MPS_11510 [Mycobacterium pseudoshottsii]